MNSNETTPTANPLDGITAALEKALQQAREQADTIIQDAKQEAERIINDAREQAERITADAQAAARAKCDMERASLAIQEHAAALHTLALGLTGHKTTPRDNTGNASGSADDDSACGSNENTNNADTIPPAPTATATDTVNTTTPTNTSRATGTPHTARRADGTTRKLAPWEQPQEPQSETAPEPEETPTIDTTEGNNPEHTSAAQDATTPPTWDAPLIIDAPLQL